MKRLLSIILFIFPLLVQGQEVNISMEVSGSELEIYLNSPDVTYSSEIFSKLTFSIKFDNSGSNDLGAFTGVGGYSFLLTNSSTETLNGFTYETYSFSYTGSVSTINGGSPLTAGSPFKIGSFTPTGSLNEFSIVDDSLVVNISGKDLKYYVQIGAVDVTGIIESNPNDLIWDGVSAWNTTPTSLTGSRNAYVKSGTAAVISSNISLNNITFENGANLTLPVGNKLTLNGNIQVASGDATLHGHVEMVGDLSPFIHGNVTLKNLNVNTTAGVTIQNGHTYISSSVYPQSGTLTTNDSLTLIATSSNDYGQIYPGSGTISGNITVQHWLDASATYNGWHSLGIPVNGASIQEMTGIEFNGFTQVPSTHNVWTWSSSDAGSGVAEGWQADPGTGNNSQGYQIYTHNTYFPISSPISITGTVVTGNKTFTGLENTEDPDNLSDKNKKGWSLLANPYASNYNLVEMFGDAGWASFSPYTAAHIYSSENSQYIAINSDISIQDGGIANASTSIKPFQGFWVKRDDVSGSNSLTLSNAYIDTNKAEVLTIYKTPKKVLRINLNSSAGDWKDQVAIYLDANGVSKTFVPSKDAYKFFSAETDNLYMVLNAENASIKALESSMAIDTLPLGVKALTNGAFTFEAKDADWDPNIDYFLHDKKQLTITDLKANPVYSFNHDTTETEGRFELILISKTYGVDESMVSGVLPFNLYVKDKTVNLDFLEKDLGIASVRVYNLAGQEIYKNKRHDTQNPLAFQLKSVRSEIGIYVLALTTKDGKNYYYQKFIY